MEQFDAVIWRELRGLKEYPVLVGILREALANDEQLWALFCDLTQQGTPSASEGVVAGMKRKRMDKVRSPEELASDGLAAWNMMLTTICSCFAAALGHKKSTVLLTQNQIHGIVRLGELVGKIPEENRSEVDRYLLALIGAYLKKYGVTTSGVSS